MADPTALVQWTFDYGSAPDNQDFVITNLEPLVIGGLAAVDLATGTVEFSADDAQHVPCGVVEGSHDGDTDNLTGDGATNRAIVRSNIKLKEVAVTGASALTDVGDYVYASDGQTLTKTASNMSPCGVITRWYTGTTCDVQLFSFSVAKTLR